MRSRCILPPLRCRAACPSPARAVPRPCLCALFFLCAHSHIIHRAPVPQTCRQIVKSGLLSLLEALAPATLFGLVTVDCSVSVYDMRGAFPSCFTVPLGAEGEISVPLTEVLPVDCMLVQVRFHPKDAPPCPPPPSPSAAGTSQPDSLGNRSECFPRRLALHHACAQVR